MPNKRSSDLLPVTIQKSMTITGGHSKKQYVLMTQPVQFEDGVADCVHVSVQEPWVSDMASGQSVCKRALARIAVLKKIKDALLDDDDDQVGEDSMLAALTYDYGQDDVHPSTPQNWAAKRRRQSSASAEKQKKIRARCILLPNTPNDEADTKQVRAAVMAGGKLSVAVDDLSWLIGYMAEEKALSGVPLLSSPEKQKSDTWNIAWNFRDSTWQGRAKAPDGTWHTLTKCVARRTLNPADRLYEESYAESKDIMFAEMQAWRACVEAGRFAASPET
jgi:hypothetical protein